MPNSPLRLTLKHFWYGCGALGVGALVLLVSGSGWFGMRLFQLEWAPQGKTQLRFEAATIDFVNHTDISDTVGSLPFMAGVVIDLNGDGRDEIVLGGGRTEPDGVFALDSHFESMVDQTAIHALGKLPRDATMGGASTDVDRDGLPDLLLARESGVWLFRNKGGVLAEGELVFVPPTEDRTTIISISPGDVDNDGNVDLFLSGYVRNLDVEGQTLFAKTYGGYSYLLTSDGAGAFVDVTSAWGVRRQHNTFTAVLADFDETGTSDLVIAQDTGVVETWKNPGGPPFRRSANPSVASYPMGIAAGDFNGDGNLDFYFSNVGHTLPELLLRGDLPSDAAFNPLYMLFTGDGRGGFKDTAIQSRAAKLGFGWGVVAADFDLDGWEDIAVAQNYAKFGQPAIIHRYAGKLLRNVQGQTFEPVEKRAGVANRLFAISPLVCDLDGDGRPDLVWVNLQGPARVFLNRMANTQSVTLRFDDSPSAYGARIKATVSDRTLVRRIVPGQGLASDQSASLFLGLGEASEISHLQVTYPDGQTTSREHVAAGTIVDLRRDVSP